MHGSWHSSHTDIPGRKGGRTFPFVDPVLANLRHADQHSDTERLNDSQRARSSSSDVRRVTSTSHFGHSIVERGTFRCSTVLHLHDRGFRLFLGSSGRRGRRDTRETHHATHGVDFTIDPMLRPEHADRRNVQEILHNTFPNNSQASQASDHLPAVQQFRPVGLRHRDHAKLDLARAPAEILRRPRLGHYIQDWAAPVDLLPIPQLRAVVRSVEQML